LLCFDLACPALPLFTRHALADAVFDFPSVQVRNLWEPLLALAVMAVMLTGRVVIVPTVLVYAAMTLGEIVALRAAGPRPAPKGAVGSKTTIASFWIGCT
jgi:hypothetical protein